MKIEFNTEERKFLLALARSSISHFLEFGRKMGIDEIPEKFKMNRGAFVTLHKEGDLRGCIGYPLPVSPLFNTIIDNAVSAAFEDPRFPSLDNSELDVIDIEISVLTVPVKVENYQEVKIGRDGIIISKHGHKGLLLPQVPVEQGWDLEQYISYGCMKAGLPDNEWRKGVYIEIFQAEVFGEKDVG